MIKHALEPEFKELVKNSDKLFVVDFWAEWCGPCRMLAPVLEQLEKTNTNINIIKIDTENEKNQSLVSNYNIRSIPTLIFLKDGKELHRTVGLMTLQSLQKEVNKFV